MDNNKYLTQEQQQSTNPSPADEIVVSSRPSAKRKILVNPTAEAGEASFPTPKKPKIEHQFDPISLDAIEPSVFQFPFRNEQEKKDFSEFVETSSPEKEKTKSHSVEALGPRTKVSTATQTDEPLADGSKFSPATQKDNQQGTTAAPVPTVIHFGISNQRLTANLSTLHNLDVRNQYFRYLKEIAESQTLTFEQKQQFLADLRLNQNRYERERSLNDVTITNHLAFDSVVQAELAFSQQCANFYSDCLLNYQENQLAEKICTTTGSPMPKASIRTPQYVTSVRLPAPTAPPVITPDLAPWGHLIPLVLLAWFKRIFP